MHLGYKTGYMIQATRNILSHISRMAGKRGRRHSRHFPGRHHNEDTEEGADSYDGFVSENKIRHPIMFLRRVLDDTRNRDT